MTKLGTCEPYTQDFTAKAKLIDPTYKNEVNRIFAQTQGWSTTQLPWAQTIAAKARGELVLLTVKPAVSVASAATGGEDTRAKAILAGLKAAGFTAADLVFGIYHEPEDNVAAGEFTEAQWCAMQVRVLGIFKAAGFRTCVCLMNWTLESVSGRDVKRYLTPEVLAVTDVLAWDCYNYGKGGGGGSDKPWTTADPNTGMYGDPAKLFGPPLALSKSLGKPAMIFEAGCLRREADTNGVERTKWWSRADLSGYEAAAHYENPEFASKTAIRDERDSLAAFLKQRTPAVADPCAAVKAELATAKTQITTITAELAKVNGEVVDLRTYVGALTTERDNAVKERDAANARIAEHEAHPV